MSDQALQTGRQYDIKLASKKTTGQFNFIHHKIDVNTMAESAASTLELNEIGLCELTLTELVPADIYKDVSNFLYLGRGFNFPVALEGALKLKEISYIHAEGFAGGELKHGTLALIEKGIPVVVIGDSLEIISNATEIKTRGGIIIDQIILNE